MRVRLLKKPLFCIQKRGTRNLLGTIVFGNSLGSLRDGVLAQLTREDQADGSLDLLAGDGGTLVVGGQLAALMGNALEDVIDKAVHNGHGLLRDVNLGVALAEDFEDIAAVGFMARTLTVLAGRGGLLDGALGGSLSGGLLFSFRGHFVVLLLHWLCTAPLPGPAFYTWPVAPNFGGRAKSARVRGLARVVCITSRTGRCAPKSQSPDGRSWLAR